MIAIEEQAFADSESLLSVTVPPSVTSVASDAFIGCTNMEFVFFMGDRPEALNISEDNTVVQFPSNVYVIANSDTSGWLDANGTATPFCGAPVYMSTVLDGYTDEQGIYYTVNSSACTAIVGNKSSVNDNAINSSGAQIIDVKIPDFVTHNGIPPKVVGFDRYAFYGNKQLESITFGAFIGEEETDECPAIWDCTFRNTERLTSITVNEDPNNATPPYTDIDGVLYGHMIVYNPQFEYTGDASVTMQGNDGKDIVIGGDKEDKEKESFPSRLLKYPEGKTDFEFTVPDGVTVIERYAFAGNPYLEEVTLNNVNVIGSHAFYNVTNLVELIGAYQIVYLEDSAFENTRIRRFNFCESLVGMGSRAFFGTRLSGDIQLPFNITYIGERVFGRCTGITSFEFLKAGETNSSGA